MELIIIPKGTDGEFDETHIPVVRVEKLEDNCSEDQVGWSFLDDPAINGALMEDGGY
jgi:hypothetical protein